MQSFRTRILALVLGLVTVTVFATVAACGVRRIVAIRGRTGFGGVFGSVLMHISILLILAGGIVRGLWGENGQIKLREGETKNEFLIENRARPLPFALHLAGFVIERDGQFLANYPADGKNPFGRVLFQGLQYSDTPLQPLVPLQFTDSTAGPGTQHKYRVIAVNTVGLKSQAATAK